MKLNRRIKRNIKNDLPFYVSSIVLTMVTAAFIIASITTGNTLTNLMAGFMDKYNVEDAEFTTAAPISTNNIEKLENDYNVTLEEISYKDVSSGSSTVRVFSPTQKINLYQVTVGNDIRNANEILLTKKYAQANNINIGDNLNLDETDYTVCEFIVKADYIYMLESLSDNAPNNEHFAVAVVDENVFSRINQSTITNFAIRYKEDNNHEVRKKINEDYTVLNYIQMGSNNRISFPKEEGKGVSNMASSFAPILFFIIVAIISLVLGRKVKKEQKQIGTLMALGYQKKEIIGHYVYYGIVPGFLGSILGILVSFWMVNIFVQFYIYYDFEPLPSTVTYNIPSIIIALLIPTILYATTAVIVTARLLKNQTVALLAGAAGSKNKNKARRIFVHSRMKFSRKYQVRDIIGNLSRSAVVILGLFVASICIIIGFIMKDSCVSVMDDAIDSASDYKYAYYLVTSQTDSLDEGESVLTKSFETNGSTLLFTINGIEEDSQYFPDKTEDGKGLDLTGYYMTSAAAKTYGIRVGDEFTFYDIASMDAFTITIEGIIADDMEASIYTSNANLANIACLDKGSYNVIVNNKELSIDEVLVSTISTKEDTNNIISNLLAPVMSVVYVVIVLGGVLCIVVVYLITNMILEENKNNISTLKVLGYHKNKISRIVLNTNHILVPISFILALPISYALVSDLLRTSMEDYSIYIGTILKPISVVICFAILYLSYMISLFMLKRKVYQVDMVESLKDNRG